MSEEGSRVHSHGVAKCLWYNDKRLWSVVEAIYQVLNLWIHMRFFYSSNR